MFNMVNLNKKHLLIVDITRIKNFIKEDFVAAVAEFGKAVVTYGNTFSEMYDGDLNNPDFGR